MSFTAETLYAATLKHIDERIEMQWTIMIAAARKSTDPAVQAAAKTMDSLNTLRESIIETWKGQDDAG